MSSRPDDFWTIVSPLGSPFPEAIEQSKQTRTCQSAFDDIPSSPTASSFTAIINNTSSAIAISTVIVIAATSISYMRQDEIDGKKCESCQCV